MKCINNNQRQQQPNIVLSMRSSPLALHIVLHRNYKDVRSTDFFSAMPISQQICLKLIYLCPHEYYYNYSLGHDRGILLKHHYHCSHTIHKNYKSATMYAFTKLHVFIYKVTIEKS